MDGVGLDGHEQATNVTKCVAEEEVVFVRRKGIIFHLGLKVALDGKRPNIVVLEADGKTPFENGTFDAKAALGSSGDAQSKRYRDCMELRIDMFAPKRGFLKTEMTLLTGAMAGMLWLAG